MEPFAGPKLKVKRAKRHISDLNDEIDAFLNRDPYRIVLENNAETKKLGWIVRITEELSDQVPLIVGVVGMRSCSAQRGEGQGRLFSLRDRRG
jgi:hypothetical protein